MLRQVAEAILYPVETRFRAEEREPGCPDVGRDQEAIRGLLEYDFQEIPRIESENGATVRSNVADPCQTGVYPLRGGKIWHVYQVVDLAYHAVPLVDTADFGGENEADRVWCRRYAAKAGQGRFHFGGVRIRFLPVQGLLSAA